MTTPTPALRDDPEELRIARQHGLYYVDRDGNWTYILDRDRPADVPRPERDVLVALLAYAYEVYATPTREADHG